MRSSTYRSPANRLAHNDTTRHQNARSRWLGVIAPAAVISLAATAADADNRKFTFVYEATTMPVGEAEYEQWVTWKTDKESDPDFDRLDFRHELEFGVTDHLQLAFYLADWRYQDGASVDNDRAVYRDSAVEVIYNLTNPVEDLLGVALYGEFAGGDELLKLEGKLILQKDIGPWTFAYNAIIEAEWEGQDYQEDNGEFAQTFGISYSFSPELSAGFELLHEIEIEDWDESQDDVLYLGPNLAYRAKGWWATVTPLFLATDSDNEAKYQTRLIFGIFF